MRQSHKFTQGDVARAIKGAIAAGMKLGRVSIDAEGRIDLIPQQDALDDAALDAATLDERLQDDEHGKG
ncbi:MAG: hypothetical protein C3F11_08885 [Methylocystaceae bacterium]|nr:MAG: hypothetical protein C3F11_08885 [Methylocystaceae bacterium]